MQLQEMLYSQGFGTRRVCAGLVEKGLVGITRKDVQKQASLVNPESLEICLDPCEEIDTTDLAFSVQGRAWEYHEKAYLMLHKPAGFECSQKPGFHPSVYSLFPSPLRMRPVKGGVDGVQAVGRLDQDTTGLLLFSDDGQFLHRLASPKKHVPKVYDVTTKEVITPKQVEKLLAGVILDDSPKPVKAAACSAQDEYHLQLTLLEGKYHQVKRMIASVGNQVAALHRSRIGDLMLPDDLKAGQWRWLNQADLVLVLAKSK